MPPLAVPNLSHGLTPTDIERNLVFFKKVLRTNLLPAGARLPTEESMIAIVRILMVEGARAYAAAYDKVHPRTGILDNLDLAPPFLKAVEHALNTEVFTDANYSDTGGAGGYSVDTKAVMDIIKRCGGANPVHVKNPT